MKKNAKLASIVGGVAIGALAVGIVVASKQVPVMAQGGNDARPIGTSSSGAPATTPTPSVAPTKKPGGGPPGKTTTKSPTTQPPKVTGPAKMKLDLTKLKSGAAPKVIYVAGRTVIGAGARVTIPASDGGINTAVPAGRGLHLITHPGDLNRKLQTFDENGKRIQVVPDVTTVKSTPDGDNSAYATARYKTDGSELRGSTITFRDNSTGETRKLSRPNDYDVYVFGVVDTTVYFRSESSPGASSWSLYRWVSGESSASKVRTVPNPSAMSPNGKLAASITKLSDNGSCTAVVGVDSGSGRWKTCDYQIEQFSPDREIALAAPAYRDGYADGLVAVLDNTNGNLIREWSGLSMMQAALEDQNHVLILAEQDDKSAIVRCSINTGACELATPLQKGISLESGNANRLGADS